MPAPAPQDFNQQIRDTNNTYAAFAPGVGQGVVNQTQNLLQGQFDAQAFYNANPGAQQQWDEWRAAGELQGWTPAQHAASFIGGMENDPRLNQYYTGGVGQNIGQSAIEAQNIQNQLNTLAKTGAINDLSTLGGKANEAFFNANPSLAGAQNVLSNGVNSLNLGAGNIGPVTFSPIGVQGGPMAGGPVGPMPGVNFGPTPQAASFGGGMGQRMGGQQAPTYAAPTFSNPFLGKASEYSSLALSPIQQMLQEQALGDLRLGGNLSGQDIRSAQQAARAGQSARGLAMGKNAVGEEILQTDALSRARLNERRGFASAVDQNAFGQQNANRQLGLGYAGLANSAEQAGNALGLGYNQLNENARQFQGNLGFNYAQLAQQDKQFGGNLGFNYAQLGQQAGMFNASNALGAQQFNANLQQQQQANDRGFGLNSTAMLGNLSNQAMGSLNAQGTGYGQANNNYQLAAGALPSYNSYLGYGQNIYDTNFNAAYANYNAAQNRNAGLLGGALGAFGTIGGAIIGGPVGSAVGGALAKKITG